MNDGGYMAEASNTFPLSNKKYDAKVQDFNPIWQTEYSYITVSSTFIPRI